MKPYIHAARRALATERTDAGDAQLGLLLTFVAGAINAGGFFAVGQYTSHVTGILSGVADNLALGAVALAAAGAAAVLAFVAGAATSAVLVNLARIRRQAGPFAYPLLLEAVLLAAFGLSGLPASGFMTVATAVPLLSFVMGLQNATVTKISGARVRTTHMTGVATDIGIELGRLTIRRLGGEAARAAGVTADRRKLALLSGLLGAFLAGGITGAVGFGISGVVFALPLAALLAALTAPSLMVRGDRRRSG
ncbi:YoaK family protein [Chthonobacter rhizosphaerae]|uniref:YoaK family protein n=1 Tax=Chthonobacter rhizosphaerae TaxID=2735553 RepID=UPI0015EF1CAE|nr:YoaK family protein [Chthonobacter rhizosphaerae]